MYNIRNIFFLFNLFGIKINEKKIKNVIEIRIKALNKIINQIIFFIMFACKLINLLDYKANVF